jgi:hypothetical protein
LKIIVINYTRFSFYVKKNIISIASLGGVNPLLCKEGKGWFNYFSKPLQPPLAKRRILHPLTEFLFPDSNQLYAFQPSPGRHLFSVCVISVNQCQSIIMSIQQFFSGLE